jgi:hypothetical protein
MDDVMKTGDRHVGAATCRIRQTNAVPERMRGRVRELCCVEVPADKQNQGYATTLIHKVCREADEANIVLVIWPMPFGDNISLGKQQLIDWYSGRFGFQCIQPDPYLMARMPGATPRILRLNQVTEALQRSKA